MVKSGAGVNWGTRYLVDWKELWVGRFCSNEFYEENVSNQSFK